MLKHLSDILPQPTAHHVRQKRILLGQVETDSNLTQIAVGNTSTRHEGDFVQVKCGKRHRLKVIHLIQEFK